MKIAAALYPIAWHVSFDAYAAKVTAWVEEAAGEGADLLVFPEYAGVEAALLGPPEPDRAGRDWVRVSAPSSTGTMAFWSGLARTHGVHILAGSGSCRTDTGFYNRARLFTPNGQDAHQDKIMRTPWERANTSLTGGAEHCVFDTTLGRIGVLVCYDAEFPELARALGADVLIVPACTDSPAGAERLRIAARARALENQCITVLSSTTGLVPACDFLDLNHGYAGIYTPPDCGFPASGILAESGLDQPGWVYGSFELGALAQARGTADAPLARDRDMLPDPPKTPRPIDLKP